MDMVCCISKDELHVMFQTMPIFALINPILRSGTETTRVDFQETDDMSKGDMSDTLMLNVKADSFPHGSMFYFRFKGLDDIITTVWSDDEQKLFSVPLYNFHTDGSSCLGDACANPNSNNFSLLLSLLNAYTTPHVTYKGDGMFSIKVEMPEKTKEVMRAKDIREAILGGKAKHELQYGEKTGIWPDQEKIGAFVPPEELRTPEARAKVLGKLTPLL